MVPLQYVDQNDPRCVPSTLSLTEDEIYENQQQLIAIDGIYSMEQYFQIEFDSDIESILTDSSDSDENDESCCSSVSSDSDSHIDSFRQFSEVLRIHRQQHKWPLQDESPLMKRNCYYDDGDDDLASLKSYDSLEDARRRGIFERSIDRDLTNQESISTFRQRRQLNKKSVSPKAARAFNFESDEESNYEESDYSIFLK